MQILRKMRRLIARTPVVGTLGRFLLALWFRVTTRFTTSTNYWESRYQKGANSGDGSYGRLSHFKAEIIQDFVDKNGVQSVLELGCGDGNQLTLVNYPHYIGLDVAPTAIELCRKRFAGDPTKEFAVCNPAELKNDETPFHAELSMSLDVIYHLVEDEVYEPYMRLLFDAADKFVIVYASNKESAASWSHVRHRKFTDWIEANRPDWKQIEFIPNRYPVKAGDEANTSFADFYIFQKRASL